MGSRAGTLFIVATPIGNLEDITARALRVLREASAIAAEDTRRTSQLLARYAITTPLTSLHEHNEGQKTPSLVARLSSGESIALVSDAGMPTVSDPGSHLIRAAIEAGVRVEALPGPSAVITALAASGLSSEAFAFLGFPPTKAKARTAWFDRLLAIGGTIVFFESPHRFRSTMEELLRRAGDCEVCVAREISKVHEELVRGPISVVLERLPTPRGEFTVVASIAHVQADSQPGPDRDASVGIEFGELTTNKGMSRREAVRCLAKRHSLSSRQIYQLVEARKKSGE